MTHWAFLATIFAGSTIIATASLAQSGADQSGDMANLCQELLAYAEHKAVEPPEGADKDAPSSAAAPPSRTDSPQSGTQGGGSVGPSSSDDTSSQDAAPPTTPVEPGAASVPAESPHASDGEEEGQGASEPGATVPDSEFKLAGGITVQQIRDVTRAGDRKKCRETAQAMRRAGADLPAALIALSAYDPAAIKQP